MSTAGMFATGGALALLSTWLPGGPASGAGEVRVLGGAALAIALVLIGVGGRLPRWSFHMVLVLAWVMVTRGIAVSGGGPVADGYALLYLLVVVNAFTACSWLGAGCHLLLALLGMAVSLSRLPGDSPALIVRLMGVTAAMCGFIGRLIRAAGHAEVDVLTGLLNRRGLDRYLDQVLARAGRSDLSVTLALIDLDGFKAVNDQHGHAAGDTLLRTVAHAWSTLVPPDGVLSRLGGDEFVMVLPGGTAQQAERLLADGRRRLPAGQRASAGTAQWQRGESASSLTSRADRALYRAKRQASGSTCHDHGDEHPP